MADTEGVGAGGDGGRRASARASVLDWGLIRIFFLN